MHGGRGVVNRTASVFHCAEHGHSNLCQSSLVVLKVRSPKSSFEQLILTLSGLISLNGMNNCRVALCVNSLLQLRPLSHGLPIAFANRGVIAQEKFEDAARFVRQVRMASDKLTILAGWTKLRVTSAQQQVQQRWRSVSRVLPTPTIHLSATTSAGMARTGKKRRPVLAATLKRGIDMRPSGSPRKNHPQSYCEPYWELTITMFTPYAVTSLRKYPITMQQTLYTSWQRPPRCT